MHRARRIATWLLCVSAAAAPLLAAGCARPAEPVPPERLAVWTGVPDGSYHRMGDALARVFTAKLPDVATTVVFSGGSIDNIAALARGEGEIAVALGDVVYTAYLRDSSGSTADRLRGIGVLYRSAVHFIVPRRSVVRRLGDLKGAQIAVLAGTLAVQRRRTAEVLLQAHGLDLATVEIRPLTLDEMRTGFREGALQAAFFASLPPNPLLGDESADLRLIRTDLAAVERAREQYPFFQPMTIPAGTHPNQPEPIETVGIDNLLVCRGDLNPDLVYRLTKTFVESLPEIAQMLPAVSLPGPDAASATPIPLHAGAARYYRERELLLY